MYREMGFYLYRFFSMDLSQFVNEARKTESPMSKANSPKWKKLLAKTMSPPLTTTPRLTSAMPTTSSPPPVPEMSQKKRTKVDLSSSAEEESMESDFESGSEDYLDDSLVSDKMSLESFEDGDNNGLEGEDQGESGKCNGGEEKESKVEKRQNAERYFAAL